MKRVARGHMTELEIEAGPSGLSRRQLLTAGAGVASAAAGGKLLALGHTKHVCRLSDRATPSIHQSHHC